MATYNESIKQILFEVQLFMNETIKTEKLNDKVKKHKTKILELINKIQEEYNALKPDISNTSNNSLRADDESIFTGGSGNSEEEVPYTENIRVTPAASLNQPLKTGYLEKRRKGLIGKISYQKRYCVIHSAVLYYYEKPTDKKQNGAFPLNGYEFREAPHLVSGAKKELSFELVGPGKRTYEFLAENKEEFKIWREAVESCHNEPISEELYEAIEDIIRPPPSRGPQPPLPIDDGEEYEIPQVELQETYEVVAEDVPPDVPAPRKASTQSVPKIAPPSIPNVPLPAPPVQPQSPKKRAPKMISMTSDPAEDFENMYFGKWDCSADTDDELKFNKGDIIHIISKDFDNQNWWVGEYKGSIGLVPKSYLAKAYELMP